MILLRINRGLDVDVLFKLIKFEVTVVEISVYISWASDPSQYFIQAAVTAFLKHIYYSKT